MTQNNCTGANNTLTPLEEWQKQQNIPPEQLQDLQNLFKPQPSRLGPILAIALTLFLLVMGGVAFFVYQTTEHMSELIAGAKKNTLVEEEQSGENNIVSPQDELQEIKSSLNNEEEFIAWFKENKRDFDDLAQLLKDALQKNAQLRSLSARSVENKEQRTLTLDVSRPLETNTFEVKDLDKILQKLTLTKTNYLSVLKEPNGMPSKIYFLLDFNGTSYTLYYKLTNVPSVDNNLAHFQLQKLDDKWSFLQETDDY